MHFIPAMWIFEFNKEVGRILWMNLYSLLYKMIYYSNFFTFPKSRWTFSTGIIFLYLKSSNCKWINCTVADAYNVVSKISYENIEKLHWVTIGIIKNHITLLLLKEIRFLQYCFLQCWTATQFWIALWYSLVRTI